MDIDTNDGGTPMVIWFVQSFRTLGIAWLSEIPSREPICMYTPLRLFKSAIPA